jgi:hypothetical protein
MLITPMLHYERVPRIFSREVHTRSHTIVFTNAHLFLLFLWLTRRLDGDVQ